MASVTDPNTPEVIDSGQGQVAPEYAPEDTRTSMAPPEPDTGQGEVADSQDSGQAVPQPQTTDEPSFFDPSQVPVELMPAYKQMQGAFTKKSTEVARNMDKVRAFDAFMGNPHNPEMVQFMAQHGYVPAHQAQMGQQQQQPYQTGDEGPESWDAVYQEAERRAEQRIMQRLAPYLGQVQAMGAQQVEAKLNQLDPKWREYEGEMMQIIQEHPSLVKHPDKLYRLAVPQEIFEARITQQVLDKYAKQGRHAATQTRATAPRSTPAKPKITSWDEAVADAQRRVRSGEV